MNTFLSTLHSSSSQHILRSFIAFDQNSTKAALLDIVKKYKESNPPIFVADQILSAAGHTVLRLPPYHPDFNSIENIWGIAKSRIASKNISFKPKDVKVLIVQEFHLIDATIWKNCVERAIRAENEKFSIDMGLTYEENLSLVDADDAFVEVHEVQVDSLAPFYIEMSE